MQENRGLRFHESHITFCRGRSLHHAVVPQEAMVQDYLADVSFFDMCKYAGLCWMGMGIF
jgi:hypothetical protein